MSRINHTDMVLKLAKPGQAVIDGLTARSAHTWHMATGVAGEIGELLENFIDAGDRENRVEELGDIEFYHRALSLEFKADTNATVLTIKHQDDVVFAMLSLTVHGAALLDAAKKYAVYAKPVDSVEVIKQLSLVRAWLNCLYKLTGISRTEALDANIDKLYEGEKARYKRGEYSDEQAQQRQDKE